MSLVAAVEVPGIQYFVNLYKVPEDLALAMAFIALHTTLLPSLSQFLPTETCLSDATNRGSYPAFHTSSQWGEVRQ